MRVMGQWMQRAGLFVPPVAIVLQLLPGDSPDGSAISQGQMLLMLLAAASLFFIGRIVEGYARG